MIILPPTPLLGINSEKSKRGSSAKKVNDVETFQKKDSKQKQQHSITTTSSSSTTAAAARFLLPLLLLFLYKGIFQTVCISTSSSITTTSTSPATLLHAPLFSIIVSRQNCSHSGKIQGIICTTTCVPPPPLLFPFLAIFNQERRQKRRKIGKKTRGRIRESHYQLVTLHKLSAWNRTTRAFSTKRRTNYTTAEEKSFKTLTNLMTTMLLMILMMIISMIVFYMHIFLVYYVSLNFLTVDLLKSGKLCVCVMQSVSQSERGRK